MATTKKKARSKKKVATSKPAAAKVDEPKAKAKTKAKAKKPEPESKPEPEVVSKKKVPTKKTASSRGRVYSIHLIAGARFRSKGFDIVAGRPLITTDEKVYEKFKNNGRFRVDVREGGAE